MAWQGNLPVSVQLPPAKKVYLLPYGAVHLQYPPGYAKRLASRHPGDRHARDTVAVIRAARYGQHPYAGR